MDDLFSSTGNDQGLHDALDFVAAGRFSPDWQVGQRSMSSVDKDVLSWMLMSDMLDKDVTDKEVPRQRSRSIDLEAPLQSEVGCIPPALPLSSVSFSPLFRPDASAPPLSPARSLGAPAYGAMPLGPSSSSFDAPTSGFVPPSVFANAGAALFSGFQRAANAARDSAVAVATGVGLALGMAAPGAGGVHPQPGGAGVDGFPAKGAPEDELLMHAPVSAARRSKRGRGATINRDVAGLSVALETSTQRSNTASEAGGEERGSQTRRRGRDKTFESVARDASSRSDAQDAPASAPVDANNLSQTCARLSAENAALRAQVRAMSVATYRESDAHEAERKAQLRRITGMVAAGAPDAALREAIMQYKDLHGDFGRDRWVALRHHLRCLKALLLPNQITKLTMWSVDHQDENTGTGSGAATASTSPVAPPPLPMSSVLPGGGASVAGVSERARDVWAELCAHTEMTAEQQARILSLRDSVRARRREFNELLSVLRELEERMTHNFQGLELQMNVLMGQLAPRQIGLFLGFMERSQPMFKVVSSLAAWPQGPDTSRDAK